MHEVHEYHDVVESRVWIQIDVYIVPDSACEKMITIAVATRLYNKLSIATSDVLRGHMRGESHLKTFFVTSQHSKKL
jgi:hypothetical protein